VSMPLVLAFAISDGWSEVAWVAGVFLALELVLINIVEPLVYGRSAGLSPIAIILAALFWTLLWGPVGLLLATPLTVCVAVMGRYMPELGYLNVILGVEPALSPQARFYQRLLAKDEDEAEDLAEDFANEKGLLALYDEMVIPALALAEQDRHAHTLDEERERFIFDTIRELVEYLEDRRRMKGEPTDEAKAKPKNVVHRPAPPVCIVGVRDEADHVAALVLARMLEAPEFNAHVLGHPLLAADTLDELEKRACKVVCLSAVPPHAAAHAGHLCKRLKGRFPDIKVVVALWMSEGSDKLESRLRDAGVDVVVTRLPDALEQLRQLTVPLALAAQNPGQNPIPRRRPRSEP
jgi:AI-2E family transporter